jgi:integrase
MEREFNFLLAEEKITTTNPKTLTVDDVKEYHLFLKNKTKPDGSSLDNISIDKDFIDLEKLCGFYGNLCVQQFRLMCPALRMRKRKKRLPTISIGNLNLIWSRSDTVPSSDMRLLRAYALVSLYIGAGLRTIEIVHSKVSNFTFTEDGAVIYLDVVKGEDSYGEHREVPIIPEFLPIIKRYLTVRKSLLDSQSATSDYIFFSLDTFEILTDKTIRQIGRIAENDLGLTFDGRMCRRIYGQYLKDMGVPIETISVDMGHSTTKTTETYYARQRGNKAISETFEVLKNRK